MELQKRYVSFDIEATGPTPGNYSMISLGACIAGDTNTYFYRELKPINLNFMERSMRIGCMGLRCLDDLRDIDCFNHESPNFDSLKVLEVLSKRGQDPKEVMADYAKWIKKNTDGYKPIQAATPISFDCKFSKYYFDNFYDGENPFGQIGETNNSLDIGYFYRELTKNPNGCIKEIKLQEVIEPNHNSLQDAIVQAKKLEVMLEVLKRVG